MSRTNENQIYDINVQSYKYKCKKDVIDSTALTPNFLGTDNTDNSAHALFSVRALYWYWAVE